MDEADTLPQRRHGTGVALDHAVYLPRGAPVSGAARDFSVNVSSTHRRLADGSSCSRGRQREDIAATVARESELLEVLYMDPRMIATVSDEIDSTLAMSFRINSSKEERLGLFHPPYPTKQSRGALSSTIGMVVAAFGGSGTRPRRAFL